MHHGPHGRGESRRLRSRPTSKHCPSSLQRSAHLTRPSVRCRARKYMTKDERRQKYLQEHPHLLLPPRDYYTPKGPRTLAMTEAAITQRRYKQRNPGKAFARRRVFVELRAGRLKRDPCSKCGSPKSEAHHSDYSKPLDVIWVCKTHHRELDRLTIPKRSF